ncbi:ISKra4 family transposase [Streptomyces sp. NPDC020719]|uniref:ISKra4 family transposase n=1 Tax=Streptomyces sp. NPDC020719 TaxID=3154896 RepID=UPI0033EDF34C
MEDYEQAAMADPFARAVSFFTQLVADLSGPDTLILPHQVVEEIAAERGRELARLLLRAHLDLRAHREEAEMKTLDGAARAALADGRSRLEHGHHRELATVVGTVTVSRCALRAPDRPNVYPADAVLALPRERHSLGVRKLAVLEAVRGSYDTALEAITRTCGKVVGKRQVEHLVQAAAVDVAAFYAARTAPPSGASTLLVLSVDGKGIVMRPGHLREATRKAAERARRTFRTRLASGEKAGRKRMATLAAVYDAEPSVRRPHDIIAPPGGRSERRPPRPGPKARAKWLTGSVEHDPDHVIAAAFDQAEARDPQHVRCWVVLIDGARHQRELIQAEAARRGVRIHIVLDLVHVIEKLWAAARCFYPATDPDAEDWIAAKTARILRGHADRAADEIRAEADDRHLANEDRTGIDKACQYLATNADFVHYKKALATGWPIASGVIEGACRHLIADRLDITGSRWSVPGAEAVLLLRAVHANGDMPQYWDFHLRAEQHRLHPAADQANYKLTA